LEGLAIRDVAIFYGHFVYFTAILYISWPFGIFQGILKLSKMATKVATTKKRFRSDFESEIPAAQNSKQ
jgi:hypothetical protein